MVHKGYKFSLKLVVPIRQINFRVQHLTCSPVYHRVCPLQASFLTISSINFWSYTFFINDLLLSKFNQACQYRQGYLHQQ